MEPTINNLRKAVMDGQHNRVKEIVRKLKEQGVDFTEVKNLAINKNQLSGGAYKKIVAAFD